MKMNEKKEFIVKNIAEKFVGMDHEWEQRKEKIATA